MYNCIRKLTILALFAVLFAPSEHYCFRERQANGVLGSCQKPIDKKTKEECCRHGGKGWTEKASGKRCEDTCIDGYCFHTLNQKQRLNKCSDSFGEMGREQCCQVGGNGWSKISNGRKCVVPCEQDPESTTPPRGSTLEATTPPGPTAEATTSSTETNLEATTSGTTLQATTTPGTTAPIGTTSEATTSSVVTNLEATTIALPLAP